MFDQEEWKSIILKLTQLTRDEKVHWELDAWDKTLSTSIGTMRYLISSKDGDDQAPWVLQVLRESSQTPTPEVIADLESAGGNALLEPRAMLFALRSAAYRESVGGPQVARQIMSDLMAIDPTDPGADSSPF